MVNCLVVDNRGANNIILGRPFITTIKAAASHALPYYKNPKTKCIPIKRDHQITPSSVILLY